MRLDYPTSVHIFLGNIFLALHCPTRAGTEGKITASWHPQLIPKIHGSGTAWDANIQLADNGLASLLRTICHFPISLTPGLSRMCQSSEDQTPRPASKHEVYIQ